jgi:SAM-dependent methyltransferase
VRKLVILGSAIGLTAVAAAVLHRRTSHLGHATHGGIVMTDAGAYDRMTSWLLGSFYAGVARDVAAAVPAGARVLDVGCGPGRLAAELAEHGLDVTAVDLDPAMVRRAADRLAGRARVEAADVASLPFPDGAFDLVVSTLSLHHWADPEAGLAEIARVIGHDGRALVWDLGGRRVPFHGVPADPVTRIVGPAVEVISASDWRWPGPLSFARRIELRATRQAAASAEPRTDGRQPADSTRDGSTS